MTKSQIASQAKVLLETALEGIFAELQDEYGVSGDISPDRQQLIENATEELADLIAGQILFNVNNPDLNATVGPVRIDRSEDQSAHLERHSGDYHD